MKLSLDIKTSLSQTLTPQQIQYLKLLQLPQIQLEQYVMKELEQNPMLEEIDEDTAVATNDELLTGNDNFAETPEESSKLIDDVPEPFEFYKMIAQEDTPKAKDFSAYGDEDSGTPYQIKDSVTFYEDLIQQLRFLPLSDEEYILGEQIVGNVDEDGYLRRDLQEIVEETNVLIAELNLDKKTKEEKLEREARNLNYNPARNYKVSEEALKILRQHNGTMPDIEQKDEDNGNLKEVTIEQAEKILSLIQNLDPPGIASRTLQECLIAQCKGLPNDREYKDLALNILQDTYDAFTKKHFHVIKKRFDLNDDEVRKVFDLIRHLNPKPGNAISDNISQTVIPDFIIEKEQGTGELLITVNDSSLPVIRLSEAYKKIKKEAKYKLFNKETKEWIRNKYEDAKFLIQAIRQRKNTMLKVMTAIAALQRNFFDIGPAGLKPLIYKDVSEATGLDISTVCRIVNGKYVQTEFGTFELKSFFSEALPNEDGEEVATSVIKQVLKDIIDSEPKQKPYSDQKLVEELKKRGYKVARRTVAKYREQLRIPVARLRKEL
jgi:RNA polymerase sigma-54 factor